MVSGRQMVVGYVDQFIILPGPRYDEFGGHLGCRFPIRLIFRGGLHDQTSSIVLYRSSALSSSNMLQSKGLGLALVYVLRTYDIAQSVSSDDAFNF